MTHALMINSFPIPSTTGSLEAYISAANRIPMLTEAEESGLAASFATRKTLRPRASWFFPTCVW
jgi:RNA polymerase sigma-32 factor